VTIHPLFRKSSLGPEEIEVLAGAYNDALKQLGLSPRVDRITEVVAKKAFELWQRGLRDRAKLTDGIVEDFLRLPPKPRRR
jgi:hypothetical protein